MLRAANHLNLEDAFASWRNAVDAIQKVDVNGKWYLKNDSIAAFKVRWFISLCCVSFFWF